MATAKWSVSTPSAKPVAAMNTWATAKRPGRREPNRAAKRSDIDIQHRPLRGMRGAPSGVGRPGAREAGGPRTAGLRRAAGAPVELLAWADCRVHEDARCPRTADRGREAVGIFDASVRIDGAWDFAMRRPRRPVRAPACADEAEARFDSG